MWRGKSFYPIKFSFILLSSSLREIWDFSDSKKRRLYQKWNNSKYFQNWGIIDKIAYKVYNVMI